VIEAGGLETLRFGPDGLVSAVVQDPVTRDVLMVGYMNREMLARTIETGDAWFWSRSRQEPWHKGATSGNFLRVREVRRNCEDNAVLLLADPVGPTCHTGARTCYYRTLDGQPVAPVAPVASAGAAPPAVEPAAAGDRAGGLDWLFAILEQRRGEAPERSYTARLLAGGVDRIGKKIGEEAAEVIIAAKNRSPEELAREMADLWYHSLVLMLDGGVRPEDVYDVLRQRHPHGTAAGLQDGASASAQTSTQASTQASEQGFG
jgi:phosphoribosyl-ATP pyrophosphohydrolase/phosphoribosyl-AMP cyclohydrolase